VNKPDSSEYWLHPIFFFSSAWICQDLLFQQEDYLRAIRALLREIVRSSKYNFEFTTLSTSLMLKPDMERFNQLDQAHQGLFLL